MKKTSARTSKKASTKKPVPSFAGFDAFFRRLDTMSVSITSQDGTLVQLRVMRGVRRQTTIQLDIRKGDSLHTVRVSGEGTGTQGLCVAISHDAREFALLQLKVLAKVYGLLGPNLRRSFVHAQMALRALSRHGNASFEIVLTKAEYDAFEAVLSKHLDPGDLSLIPFLLAGNAFRPVATRKKGRPVFHYPPVVIPTRLRLLDGV